MLCYADLNPSVANHGFRDSELECQDPGHYLIGFAPDLCDNSSMDQVGFDSIFWSR